MSSKIKLVFFHPYSHIGGADNSLYRLIKNLDLKDFSITFISLNNSFLKKLLNKNIEFKQINSSRTLYAIGDLKKIINKFTENKKFKKVILISNQNFANIASYFATKNNPNVKTIFIFMELPIQGYRSRAQPAHTATLRIPLGRLPEAAFKQIKVLQ